MTDAPSTSLRDEFSRRIGRNLLCYQQIEAELRALLSVSGGVLAMNGTATVLRGDPNGRPPRMLGELARALAALIQGDQPTRPDIEGGNWAWSVWRVECDTEFSEDLRQRMATMVRERNELVHHATQRWKLTDEASLQNALSILDEQRERALSVHTTLRELLEDARSAMKVMQDYIDSAEFMDHLRSAQVYAALGDAVLRAARADGWTPVSQAGHLFQTWLSSIPEAERLQLPKLSRLLRESGAFELREDAVTGGGVRTLCRLRVSGS